MKTKDKKLKLSMTHIIIALISIYVMTVFIRQEIVMRDLKKKNEVADIQLKSLKNEVKSIEGKIDQSNEGQYIEKMAREEFDMIKPNEIIYRNKSKLKSYSFSD